LSCHGAKPLPLEKVKVKHLYECLRYDAQPAEYKGLRTLPAPPRNADALLVEAYNERWKFLREAPIPPKARFVVQHLVHGRLYLGQSRDRPNPRCQGGLTVSGGSAAAPPHIVGPAQQCKHQRDLLLVPRALLQQRDRVEKST